MPVRQVPLRLTDEKLAAIDKARGDMPRERWLRRAIDRELGHPLEPDRPLPRRKVEHVRSSAQAKSNVSPIPKKS